MVVVPAPGFVPVEGARRQAYNEVAFRHFLALEVKRAERSAHPLLLMLVKLRKPLRNRPELATRLTASMFSVLDACVREVDFFGWYCEGTVAAVVFVPGGPVTDTIRVQLKDRVVGGLQKRLSPDEAAYLQVRVVEIGRRPWK